MIAKASVVLLAGLYMPPCAPKALASVVTNPEKALVSPGKKRFV
jgi:hypothetical protein